MGVGTEVRADGTGKILPVYDSAAVGRPFREELRELWAYRDLTLQWAARNVTLRYKRSVLGVLWTLIEPLMLTLILTVVFSTAFRFPMANFPIYLLSGLLLFDFFSRSTLQIVEEIVASSSLAKRIRVPRSAFAMASILSYLFNWLVALVPLFAIVLILRHPLNPAALLIPIGVLLTALFTLGVGLLVATLGVFFHDFKLAFQVLLTAWFYCTPIIYPIEVVPDAVRRVIAFNPLQCLVRLVRDPVYQGTIPPASVWLAGVLVAMLTAALGWWVFTRARDAFDYRI